MLIISKFGLLFLTASLYISLALVFPASVYIINHYTQCNQSVNCNHFGLCKGIIVLLENLCSCNNFIIIFWLSTALWLPALSNCNGYHYTYMVSCLAPTSLEMASKSISVVTWSIKLSYIYSTQATQQIFISLYLNFVHTNMLFPQATRYASSNISYLMANCGFSTSQCKYLIHSQLWMNQMCCCLPEQEVSYQLIL